MKKASIFILTGAFLWGTIGFYVKFLYAYGFTSMEVVTIRAITAAIILISYLVFKNKSALRLKRWTDIKYFIGTGIFSIIFFNYTMFKTIELASISISAALLYTGPAFVVILSRLIFKEKLTNQKLIALILTLIGTSLVVELFPLSVDNLPISTILIGLCSGLGYALYSIFSKFALKKYSSLVITTYTFLVAAIVLLPFFSFKTHAALLMDWKVILLSFGLGFLPTAVAYIVYTYGLNLTEASKASILTTVEPVVATLVGIFIFSETFHSMQFLGMFIIIAAVILMQLNSKMLRQQNR